MADNLVLALEITGIGMGLVFAAIVLFWAIMAAIVRVGTRRRPALITMEGPAPAAPAGDQELKRRAAAVAVAVALDVEQASGPRAFPLPPTALVSAWQAVTRANTLKQRGSVR